MQRPRGPNGGLIALHTFRMLKALPIIVRLLPLPAMTDARPIDAIELESTEALRAHLDRAGHLRDTAIQGLDLRDDALAERLLTVSARDAYFLGCRLARDLERHIHKTGGTIFPIFEDVPFDPYRTSLYTPDELMAGYEPDGPPRLADTADGRIYAHYTRHHRPGRPTPVMAALAYRIHDHAIDNALYDLLHPRDAPEKKVVGVMGGHRMRRDEAAFLQVTRIGWKLARHGYFVATGGGPGAMEAANLGAYLAGYDAAAVDEAVALLAERPRYEDAGYFDRAYAVRERYPDGRESLAIPTWFYGHEPSNLFARHVAKYFANSLREDGLLGIARHGVLFAPGSAGTIQEVFMDAAQNQYVTFGAASPMVFFDRDFWTTSVPVYPLLSALADGHAYRDLLTVTSEVETAVRFIVEHEPIPKEELPA